MHLARGIARTDKKLTRREFVLNLIEEALEAAERQIQEEAGVSPCEAPEDEDDPQPPEDAHVGQRVGHVTAQLKTQAESPPEHLRIGMLRGAFCVLGEEVIITRTLTQNATYRFIQDEMDIAKGTDLPNLLSHLGYKVQRLGSYYTTKEMDSIRIKNRCTWRRYSTGQSGDVITFLQEFCSKSFPEAVNYLLEFTDRRVRDSPSRPLPRTEQTLEKLPLSLPRPTGTSGGYSPTCNRETSPSGDPGLYSGRIPPKRWF